MSIDSARGHLEYATPVVNPDFAQQHLQIATAELLLEIAVMLQSVIRPGIEQVSPPALRTVEQV